MNFVEVSTDDMYVIGTQALATCVGVLLYCEEKKKAIVAHVSSNVDKAINDISREIYFNGFDKENIKYLIIPGYYKSGYLVDEILNNFCSSFLNFEKIEEKDIPNYAVEIDKDTPSCQFAFDALNGKFVTDKVLFGVDYIDFMNFEKILVK